MILLCPPEKSTHLHYPLDPKKIRAEGSMHNDTTYLGSDRQDFYRHGKKYEKLNEQIPPTFWLGLPYWQPSNKWTYNSINFFFLFIGREPTTWPANNCLKISVLLQIIFCSCVIETTLLCENGSSLSWAFRKRFNCWELWKIKLTQSSNDKIIIELSYRKISWFVSVSQIIYLPQPFGLGK